MKTGFKQRARTWTMEVPADGRPVRGGLQAVSLDVVAIVSVMVARTISDAFGADVKDVAFWVLAALIPPAATLAALVLSLRSLEAPAESPATFLSEAAAVLSGGLLLLSGALAVVLVLTVLLGFSGGVVI